MNSRKRKIGQLRSGDICWGQLLWHQRLHLCNKPLWSLILGHTFAHICHLCFRQQKVIMSLVVIKSIDIKANRSLVASLMQFASNLCYGTNKFRRMLIAGQ